MPRDEMIKKLVKSANHSKTSVFDYILKLPLISVVFGSSHVILV